MTASAPGGPDLRDWIGGSESVADFIAPAPVAALNATLDRNDPSPAMGDPLPQLYHWLYFLAPVPTSELDTDGHAKRGGFLPPVALPRRMWAAAQLDFPGRLHIGEEAVRSSVIEDVTEKTGRSGPLVFVEVRHDIEGADGIAVVDRQTLVYRAAPRPGEVPPAGRPAPDDADFSRIVEPTPALLFRYSALIFNAHRIHYDHPFATGAEGYPGLVVHGPLIATLLADLVHRAIPGRDFARFRCRAVKPVFADAPFSLCGRQDEADNVALWARDTGGDLCMEAAAELA